MYDYIFTYNIIICVNVIKKYIIYYKVYYIIHLILYNNTIIL